MELSEDEAELIDAIRRAKRTQGLERLPIFGRLVALLKRDGIEVTIEANTFSKGRTRVRD